MGNGLNPPPLWSCTGPPWKCTGERGGGGGEGMFCEDLPANLAHCVTRPYRLASIARFAAFHAEALHQLICNGRVDPRPSACGEAVHHRGEREEAEVEAEVDHPGHSHAPALLSPRPPR